MGWTNVISISFEQESKAINLYNRLTKWGSSLKYIHISLREKKILEISGEKGIQTYTSLVFIPTFVQFIVDIFEGPGILDMLKEDYYYVNQDECLLIYNMFQSFKKDAAYWKKEKGVEQRKEYLAQLMQEFFVLPISFSYESFVMFRLKEYREEILTLLGRAIDEYKLEQSYQICIQNVREYVRKKTMYLNKINLVISDEIMIYDDTFQRIPLEQVEVDVDLMKKYDYLVGEKMIASLVSLAPRMIHIYSTSKNHPLVVGLSNIFQERVKCFPYSVYAAEQME